MEISATHSLRLGDILVTQGVLSRAKLEQLVTTARGRLGDYLRAHSHVDGLSVAQAIAKQQHLHYVDLIESPPEPQLFTPRDLDHYIAHQFIPYCHRGNVLTLATTEPSPELHDFAQAHYGMKVAFAVTTPRDLALYFASRGATITTRRARHHLRRRFPHLTADRILLPHQSYGLAAIAGLLTLSFIFAPMGSWHGLIVASTFFYLATLIIKFEFYRQGVAAAHDYDREDAALAARAAALEDATLPIYSILVPLYHENQEVIARLIVNLNALDYPKEKLDIKLVCEADDTATIAAIKALRPPETMAILVVPPSQPRTKPKACNAALQQVRGEYVVIFDAEDAPAPDQLKRAVAMFRAGPANLACLQAALNYYNRDENLLTQLFAIEYSSLFRLMLPGLERMRLPIPLGGTSNHLRTEALRAVGGWDAFNVTEDADLGVRLSYLGFETRTLPSLTLEESPISLRAWLRQRSRWIKGYIQTWLVYTRDTAELKRRLGTTGYYGFQFFVGAPALTFLFAPIFWGAFILSLSGALPESMPAHIQWLCGITFVGGAMIQWLFAHQVLQLEGWQHMRRAFILYPLYWLLHSVAAARALAQLITAPHYWEKTRHGVSKFTSWA